MSQDENGQINRFGLIQQDGRIIGLVLSVNDDPTHALKKLKGSRLFGLPSEVRINGTPADERSQFVYRLRTPLDRKDDRAMLMRHVIAAETDLTFIEWEKPSLSGSELIEQHDTAINMEGELHAIHFDLAFADARLRQYQEWLAARTSEEETPANEGIWSEGFVKLPTKLLRDPKLDPYDKLTWAGYKAYDWQKGYCVPSQRTVARDIGISERKVREAEAKLRATGFMTKTRRGGRKTDRHHFPDQPTQSAKPKPRRKPKA
jgi:hypothetical protein